MTALEQLHSMVGTNEKILWSGRPIKKCFMLECIFNPLLPFALVWGLFDGFFIFMMRNAEGPVSNGPVGIPLFLVAFFALHLMPVWIYLGGVLFSSLRYKNAAFLVTDKGVYISGGVFSLTFNHKPFMEISHVNLHCGVIDRMLGVGDVVFGTHINLPNIPASLGTFSRGAAQVSNISIYDIPDYQEVYSLVKQLQQDIYSDVQYPNDLRPKENHGYNTDYIPPEK